MFANLRERGKPYAMEFKDPDRASNSRLALLAGEFARDMGRFDEFHENVFRAFFTDLKDIGQLDILLEIASNCGLNPKKLKLFCNESRHLDRLNTTRADAQWLGIRSIPAFVFENYEVIIGALKPEDFRKALEDIQSGTYADQFGLNNF